VAADEQEIPVTLADRPVRITLLRAWRSMGFWQRTRLSAELLASVFSDAELSEEDLRRLKSRDMLNELMSEMAGQLPTLKRVLIDERDLYLADRIRDSEGQTVVAIVGAGHLEGIVQTLHDKPDVDLEEISKIPAPSPWGRVIAWGIPTLIVAAIITIGVTKGSSVAGQNLGYWVLANGIPSALGALLALAHPFTIIAAFLAAPLTSLNPAIGAGYVTGLVQTWVSPPQVKDFQTVVDDASRFSMWWKNRVLRVILATILPMFGSVLGTFVGGWHIFQNLFGGS
ncbi:MAG: TraB family protein, partial [Acidobacteriota bacterium]|nr:TraB family protein [Acidobacteriota bacterium]